MCGDSAGAQAHSPLHAAPAPLRCKHLLLNGCEQRQTLCGLGHNNMDGAVVVLL